MSIVFLMTPRSLLDMDLLSFIAEIKLVKRNIEYAQRIELNQHWQHLIKATDSV